MSPVPRGGLGTGRRADRHGEGGQTVLDSTGQAQSLCWGARRRPGPPVRLPPHAGLLMAPSTFPGNPVPSAGPGVAGSPSRRTLGLFSKTWGSLRARHRLGPYDECDMQSPLSRSMRSSVWATGGTHRQ